MAWPSMKADERLCTMCQEASRPAKLHTKQTTVSLTLDACCLLHPAPCLLRFEGVKQTGFSDELIEKTLPAHQR